MAPGPVDAADRQTAATGDVIVGAAGIAVVILGADVPDRALIAVGTFLAATVTGILGWALVTLWNLSQLVARMSERVSDHERRL